MSQHSDYLSALVPPRFTVLGMELKPLSLGHKVLLEYIESPFETDGLVDVPDIVLAAMICSRTFEEGVELLMSDDLKRRVSEVAVALQFKGRWPFRRVEPIRWPEKVELMRLYFDEHNKCPLFSVDAKAADGSPDGCPLIQRVRVTLMSKLRLTDSQVMNRSWPLCLWDYLTIISASSSIRIIDKDAEERLRAALEKEVAA